MMENETALEVAMESAMGALDTWVITALTTLVVIVIGFVGTLGPKESYHEEIPNGYEPKNDQEKKEIEEFDRIQELGWIPYLYKSVRVHMVVFMGAMHVLSAIALMNIFQCERKTIIATLVLYFFAAFGITAGAHRLYSHKAYKAHFIYRVMVMLCSSLANQGSILHWSRDHRIHHKFSETKADPHNALRGLFFSHCGWLLVERDPRVKFATEKQNVDDIKDLPEVVLQDKLDPVWNCFWAFAFPALLAVYGWGEDPWLAVLVPGVLRYTLNLHGTWLVNSLAHWYGERPYDDINPSENPIVSLFAIGEGWHCWHHAYPYDYAASELGVMQQFNPTKFIIDFCAGLGLVWDRRRALEQWENRKKRRGYKHVDLVGAPLFKQRVVS